MKPTEQKTMLDFLNEVSIEEGHTGWRMVYDQHNYFDCNYIPQEAGRRYANWAISQMQPEWVSVEDRLPEINQQVLVVDKGKVKNAVYEQQGDYRLFFLEKDGIFHYSNVTHWNYLPQPPTK